ncbi:MAG: DUF2155 domain-containing protein [Methylobacteriaceae bacterium]|jgi:hypothetical protein|nr:DUF2155 domain-containing protein [Methylobacteriaceae bacterium]
MIHRKGPFLAPFAVRALLLGAALAAGVGSAAADKIKNPIALFEGLDKITGRIVAFEVAVGETVQFGALQMTPRVCYTRPATEEPNTTAFLEVDEITLDGKRRRIFTGWMFAASPGLHGIEHPIYDLWVTNCKGGTEVIKDSPETSTTDCEGDACATNESTPDSDAMKPQSLEPPPAGGQRRQQPQRQQQQQQEQQQPARRPAAEPPPEVLEPDYEPIMEDSYILPDGR